jgi:hypothetical protein
MCTILLEKNLFTDKSFITTEITANMRKTTID